MRIATFLVITFGLLVVSSNAQQCPQMPIGFVCITQTSADRIAHDLDELKAARDTIKAFENERTFNDRERAASKILVDALNAAFDARGKVVADQAMIIEIQAKALTLYSELVDKLTKQINKPQSAWSKFGRTLEKIAILAAGIYIGGL